MVSSMKERVMPWPRMYLASGWALMTSCSSESVQPGFSPTMLLLPTSVLRVKAGAME